MTLLNSCQVYLRQAEDLLARLDAVHYTMLHANCFGATVGGHIRHCLDHFELLLDGLPSGRIDYDLRQRKTPSELDPSAAITRIREVASRLNLVQGRMDDDAEIEVKLDCGGETAHWKRSSIGRELQFLVSHLVHHYAIIGVMCHSMEVVLPADFGIAPSTIRHLRAV